MATYKVTARSGLRVRSKPNGTILTAMPYGTTVSGDGKKQSTKEDGAGLTANT